MPSIMLCSFHPTMSQVLLTLLYSEEIKTERLNNLPKVIQLIRIQIQTVLTPESVKLITILYHQNWTQVGFSRLSELLRTKGIFKGEICTVYSQSLALISVEQYESSNHLFQGCIHFSFEHISIKLEKKQVLAIWFSEQEFLHKHTFSVFFFQGDITKNIFILQVSEIQVKSDIHYL